MPDPLPVVDCDTVAAAGCRPLSQDRLLRRRRGYWDPLRRRGAEEASRRSRGGAGLSTQSETGRYRGGLVPGVPHES